MHCNQQQWRMCVLCLLIRHRYPYSAHLKGHQTERMLAEHTKDIHKKDLVWRTGLLSKSTWKRLTTHKLHAATTGKASGYLAWDHMAALHENNPGISDCTYLEEAMTQSKIHVTSMFTKPKFRTMPFEIFTNQRRTSMPRFLLCLTTLKKVLNSDSYFLSVCPCVLIDSKQRRQYAHRQSKIASPQTKQNNKPTNKTRSLRYQQCKRHARTQCEHHAHKHQALARRYSLLEVHSSNGTPLHRFSNAVSVTLSQTAEDWHIA